MKISPLDPTIDISKVVMIIIINIVILVMRSAVSDHQVLVTTSWSDTCSEQWPMLTRSMVTSDQWVMTLMRIVNIVARRHRVKVVWRMMLGRHWWQTVETVEESVTLPVKLTLDTITTMSQILHTTLNNKTWTIVQHLSSKDQTVSVIVSLPSDSCDAETEDSSSPSSVCSPQHQGSRGSCDQRSRCAGRDYQRMMWWSWVHIHSHPPGVVSHWSWGRSSSSVAHTCCCSPVFEVEHGWES